VKEPVKLTCQISSAKALESKSTFAREWPFWNYSQFHQNQQGDRQFLAKVLTQIPCSEHSRSKQEGLMQNHTSPSQQIQRRSV